MSKQRLISRVALAAAMIAPGMALASGDVTDIQTRIDKGWELVWQDEFEGKDVDESNGVGSAIAGAAVTMSFSVIPTV